MPSLRARRLAAAGLLLALACLPASTAAAQDAPRIAPTVSVAGVDLSGLTLEQATAKLDAKLSAVAWRVPSSCTSPAGASRARATSAKLTLEARAIATAALAATPGPTFPGWRRRRWTPLIPVPLRHSRLAVKAFAAQVAAGVSRAARNALDRTRDPPPAPAPRAPGLHRRPGGPRREGRRGARATRARRTRSHSASRPSTRRSTPTTILRTYGTVITVEQGRVHSCASSSG